MVIFTISEALAGVISRFFIAPLDVIKIRFQLQSVPLTFDHINPLTPAPPVHVHKKYISILQSCKLIFQEEGFRGLFKGNLPAEYLYLTYSSTQFLVYFESKKKLKSLCQYFKFSMSSEMESFLSGAIAGSVATAVTYPFDLLRTRFAVQGKDKVYKGMCSAFLQIRREEGVKGFYRGLSPALYQIIPYMGIMFSTQNVLKRNLEHRNFSIFRKYGLNDLISGGFAGIISKTLVMPFDVVRKRLQVQGPTLNQYVINNIPIIPNGLNFVSTTVSIVKGEGILALYKGLIPGMTINVGLLKAAPSAAISFWIVGWCREVFNAYNEKQV